MKATIHITLKKGVLDTQGKAVQSALEGMEFKGLSDVRIGKYIELDLKATDKASAETEVKAMCEKLLANTVIENYSIELQD